MAKQSEWSLASLIERGGVYYDVPGLKMKDMLAGLIDLLPPVPFLDPAVLYQEILEREALMSTGIGRGIALPHPRNLMQGKGVEPLDVPQPLVVLAFPLHQIDWNTPDGSSVHTVFLIVSSSAPQHLNTLSKINFLCQQEKFYSLITARSAPDDIITAIREAETAWAEQ